MVEGIGDIFSHTRTERFNWLFSEKNLFRVRTAASPPSSSDNSVTGSRSKTLCHPPKAGNHPPVNLFVLGLH